MEQLVLYVSTWSKQHFSDVLVCPYKHVHLKLPLGDAMIYYSLSSTGIE